MKTTIRLAGAQIPVGTDIQINKKEIFKALDWAKETGVDCLLTPEGSLSGYCNNWQGKLEELMGTLTEVEEYQKKCGVGLHLGTNYPDRESLGLIYRNQIRHYAKDGKLLGLTNKTFTLDEEGVMGRNSKMEPIVSIPLTTTTFLRSLITNQSPERSEIHAIGLVCNDMWGAHYRDESSIIPLVNDFLKYRPEIQIIFHSTNGRKINGSDPRQKTFVDWHNSVLHVNATFAYPILTVDSCTPWDWDGNEEDVDKYPTSSQSGLIDFSGWLTDVPNYGRQYFYHDYDISARYIDKIDQYYKKISLDL
ncbi:hypothetical protein PSSM2_004 [Prochlorococcus phage P-SSM2]|jgi:hypothetical protein|uniref:CN hydrolase domain-containing protein n=2 Tax=Salacisavirus pssm2 TaxID=2734140 RepID=Q58N00_BPPRM|nr:hypothetical protein PSSM2_004 [Prochlorococcus phage P-SSM2]AAX44382.1 hypothetical protein PSSM2_004 [Prochlorococcus phage P-SSM2]ACY75880.1 conserved hypothetical protein [Prochlorococcus phage P-SSM2]AGN12265.1 hypothetical protein PRTG_00111 [Prochlorococcus phage P-SSM5]